MSARGRAATACLWIVVATIAAISSVVLWQWYQGPPDHSPVILQFVYTPDAEDLVTGPIAAFNKTGTEVDGHPVTVAPTPMPSGETERGLARRTTSADVWLPASSAWTGLLNHDVSATWAPPSPSLVHSPQVVAIWEPLARRLGWPDRPVSWRDLLKLGATDPDYRYGHTNPDFSTSGLNAMIAEYAAVTGHSPGGLTAADTADPEVTQAVSTQEDHIVHYGDTAASFLDQMARYRGRYASWVITQETSLVGFRQDHPALRPRLVAIYPSDGTYLADYPLVAMAPAAPGVDELRRQAALVFQDWLPAHVSVSDAADHGYRSGPVNAPALPPIDHAHGADPAPPRLLPLPDPAVVSQIRHSWPMVRKPADVGLVVDRTCLSPAGQQITSGVETLLNGFSSRDRVGLWAAGASVTEPQPPAVLGATRWQLLHSVAALEPSRAGAVFDAIATAHDAIAALPGSGRNQGVIVMTDGRSDVSRISVDALERQLQAGHDSERVRVFTVACSATPDMQVLRRISYASQGEAFAATLADIGTAYRSLSAYY